MHLDVRLSSINTRKRKLKLTKGKLKELELRWREHNRTCKRNHNHAFRFGTLEEYIDYSYGKIPKKDISKDRSHYRPELSYAQQRIAEFNEKYPSSTEMTTSSKGDGIDAKWQKEKQEISATYTIAPAYNKGAYQVVPKNEIKHIGK
jgi:hypothetical protein|tara:strand:- start:163 stop:603 length:441 start_codon:yes stop_codon:yes gene_type:complete